MPHNSEFRGPQTAINTADPRRTFGRSIRQRFQRRPGLAEMLEQVRDRRIAVTRFQVFLGDVEQHQQRFGGLTRGNRVRAADFAKPHRAALGEKVTVESRPSGILARHPRRHPAALGDLEVAGVGFAAGLSTAFKCLHDLAVDEDLNALPGQC